MARTKKVLPEGVKVAFEALTGRPRGRGIFGIEDEGDEVARQAKLHEWPSGLRAMIAGMQGIGDGVRSVASGSSIKGRAREVVVDGGTVRVERAYYVCPGCGTTSYPLDEQLGFGEGKNKADSREVGVTGSVGSVPSSPAGVPDTVGE